MMKTQFKITLLAILLIVFSCSKDNSTEEQTNQAPTAPKLLAPANESTNVDVTLPFSWEAATDADGDSISYNVYADTTTNPTTLIGTTSENTFEPTERLSLLETYRWKVIAKDGNGGESGSEIQSFNTRGIKISVSTSNNGFGRGLVTTFDDNLWSFKTDGSAIFNSTDGIDWKFPGLTVKDDKLWIIGGILAGTNELVTDVWFID